MCNGPVKRKMLTFRQLLPQFESQISIMHIHGADQI